MDTKRRAGVFEILGSWLGIWTPPRDVEVPPVPWRAVGVGAAGLVVVAVLVVLFAVPAIDGAKDRRATADAERSRTIAQAERSRITREQRPRSGGAPAPAASADDATRVRARRALLGRATTAIHDDAVARARAGELSGRIGTVRCTRAPGSPALGDLTATRGAFDCFVPTVAIGQTDKSPAGQIGYPFRAVLDWRRFRFTWCKVNQIPGEQIIPDPRKVVALPAACHL